MSDQHLYYLPTYNVYPVPVTFSTVFHNYSYWKAIKEGENVQWYFNGLGLETHITDTRYPFFWTHIEDKNTRYQAYNILRYGTNAGDNVYRFTRNGVDYIDKIKTALTLASNEDIVGVIQLPMADRLNT